MKKAFIISLTIFLILICTIGLAACNMSINKIIDNNSNDIKNPNESVIEYSVTYDANGGNFADGTNIYVQKVNEDTLLTAPTSPTRQGYSFTGWSKTQNSSDIWQFAEEKVNKDTILYAQWANVEEDNPIITVKKYTVTYDANGGNFADDTNIYVQKVNEDTLLTAPTSPTRQGYSFTGWSKTQNGLEIWQFAEDKINEDIILYAQWIKKSATVLSVEGASIEDNSIFMLVNNNIDYVSLAKKVVCSDDCVWRLYYDRLGLTEIPTKIAAQKTGKLGNGDNVFFIVVTSQDGTQTNTYELKIHRSYEISINYIGVYGDVIETKAVYSGNEYLVDYTPSITGYTFNCWKDKEGIKATSFTPYSSTNLYADCTANKYTAMLDVNGGNAISKSEYTVTYDSEYAFPNPSRTGYAFLGWFDNSTQITDASGNSLGNWTFANNSSITAHWRANSYNITLSINNLSAGTISGSGEYSYDSDVTISASTNNGYTWVGWYDSNNSLVTRNASHSFKMGLDESYTAKWSKVTLESNDISAGSVNLLDSKYNFGDEVVITANDKKYLGYTWLGWYNGENKITKDLSYTLNMSEEDVTYTAKWKVNDEMLPFEFTSSESDCTIISVKNKQVIEIVLPDYVTIISSGAFLGCSSLTCIIIPSKVKNIGASAFSACESLESIEIPRSVTSIGGLAFKDCNRLIIYCEIESKPNNWSSSWNSSNRPVVWNCKGHANDEEHGVTESGIKWGLTKEGIMTIEGYSGTSTEIVIPSIINGYSVTSVDFAALYGCSGLTSITLPFVGSTKDGVDNTHFGYIFGASRYSNNSQYVPSTLKEVIITGGTYIGNSAFYGCSSLTSITLPFVGSTKDGADNAHFGYIFGASNYSCNGEYIPSNLKKVIITGGTSIEQYAFNGCYRLTSIEIPSSVTSIGNSAFYGCSGLTSITLPFVGSTKDGVDNTHFGYIFGASRYSNNSQYVPSTLKEVKITGGVNIGQYAFYDCRKLISIEIPSSVTSLGDWVFYDCGSLTSIEIPNGVTSIGNHMFCGCSNLTNIDIPNSIVSIGAYAFYDCRKLISIEMPSSVTSIGEYAFYGCTGLASIELQGNLTSIEDYTFFGCISLVNIIIPSGVTSIGQYAFFDCGALTRIEIPRNVMNIGNNAFGCCSDLEIITVDIYNEKYVGEGNCVIEKATNTLLIGCNYSDIPNYITSIGSYAFVGCSSLVRIIIPRTVTSIGNSAFYVCSGLTIYCEVESLPSGWKSGWNDSNCPVVWNCKNNEIASDGYIYFVAENGMRYALKDGKAIVAEQALSIRGDIIIPNLITFKGTTYVITGISDSAFGYCNEVTSVTISYGITSIGQKAFYKCSGLKSITIPSSVVKIGSSAFSGCINITIAEIPTMAISYIPKDNLNIVIINSGTSIGRSAFQGCKALTTIDISSNVISIEDFAFAGCNSLTSIEIPSSVMTIGSNAFLQCSSLTSIVIPSSVTNIGDNTFSGCNDLTIYCEAENQPSEWSDNWNCNCPVVWGYRKEN